MLVLDEPTNDVDTDMLTATEDLLDSWPGTLIVVSHDRYLLERITDQQYAISTAGSGICRAASTSTSGSPRHEPESTAPRAAAVTEGLSGAELRSVEKEISSIDRSLAKLADRIEAKHDEMAAHDQSDHVGLGRLTAQLRELESQVAEQESRWPRAIGTFRELDDTSAAAVRALRTLLAAVGGVLSAGNARAARRHRVGGVGRP